MLHILAPYSIAELAFDGVQLVLAATQTGLLFTRLSTASSAPSVNRAASVVIPAIYGACTIVCLLCYVALILVHVVELRKGELGQAPWRGVHALLLLLAGVTALQLVTGAVTIGFNYTDSNHWYTDGSKAFNKPFTITFILYNGLAVLHLLLLLRYKQRVLSQGPRPKGRIGDDYERVGAEFSHSLRRANRVEDGSSGNDGEMRERLPLSGADAGSAPSVPMPVPRTAHFQSPSGSSAATSPVRSSYHHHQQRSSYADTAGVLAGRPRRQNSSSGYADYEDEEEEEGDAGGFRQQPGHVHSHSHSGAYSATQPPITHAQQPSFGSAYTSTAYPSGNAYATPAQQPQLQHQHQQSSQSYADEGHEDAYRAALGHVAHQPSTTASGGGMMPHAREGSAGFVPARLVPDYTGTTALPAYSEPGHVTFAAPVRAEPAGHI